MRSALVSRYGEEIVHSRHPILTWLVQYGGQIYTRFNIGVDGKSGYQRARGRPYRAPDGLPEFGECVWYKPLKSKGGKQHKFEPKFEDGIFCGMVDGGIEFKIGTKDGVVKARTIRCKPVEQAWDKEQMKKFVDFGLYIGVSGCSFKTP